MFFNIFKLALKNIWGKKFRSFLTMLGIIIGIAAVIIIMSVGAGAQSLIINEINNIGTDKISILPGGTGGMGPPAGVMGIKITSLTYDDFVALTDQNNIPYIIGGVAYVLGSETLVRKDVKENVSFTGVTEDYLQFEKLTLDQGTFFSAAQIKEMEKVVVLGDEIRRQFFTDDEDPVDQIVRFANSNYRVIGVLKKTGSKGFSNYDKNIIVPFKVAQKEILGINYVNLLRLQADDASHVEVAVQFLTEILKERHDLKPNEENDFTISSAKQALSIFESITNALRYFLASIAAISLLVGGIGIMNIMLISVNEKIYEIGLRKAVGAQKRDIMLQFLTETLVLTLFAGIIGIIIGASVSFLVAAIAKYLGYNWSYVISLSAIFLGCGISFVLGLVFGIYPAIKAAKLKPIDALRYE